MLSGFVYPLVDDEAAYWYKVVNYADECDMFFGGIRGTDTCVIGENWYPGDITFEIGQPVKTSSLKTFPFYDPTAIHELEVRQTLCDTMMQWASIDEHTRDTMEPLGILVRKSILASKKSFLRRSVIVDCSFTNISDSAIHRACIGIVVNAPMVLDSRAGYNGLTARQWAETHTPQSGSVCGLLRSVPGIIAGVEDTLNIAWMADDDGDGAWTNNKFTFRNPTAALGVRILSAPAGAPLNYNWWRNERYGISEHTWGPRKERDLFYRLSDDRHPHSDRDFYHWMTNGEIDYGSSYAAVDMTADGWIPPFHNEAVRLDMADGDTSMNFMLSIGPIEEPLLPGDSINFAYAIFMGDDFHYDPFNRERNFRSDNPERYLKGLDYSKLISAAQWVGWYYDNPGIDTDGDGYAGEFYLVDCNGRDCDSVYFSGDGVPDYKGPLPPPPPDDLETETFPTKIIARWTGRAPEFARDRHARRPDWEGYKVYVAEHDTARGWSLLASWDREDWVRYSYNDVKETWVKNSHAKTLDQWRRELNDPEFDPRDHTMPSFSTGYQDIAVDTFRAVDGSIVEIRTHDRWSYFVAQDANHANEYRDIDGLHRNRIQMVGTVDTVIDGEAQQYGRYEFEMETLSQSKVYFLAVTSFDYGDYRNYVDPEESAPRERFKRFMAVNDAQVAVDSALKVTVYPNPYKAEFYDNRGNVATYQSQGYEYSPSGKFDERDRRIWFANLPDTAVIEIYSLDGDLIRIIRHPDDFLTKYESVVGWDLISRNTQAVTSGIYIWKVTSRLGSQVGKLVIIK